MQSETHVIHEKLIMSVRWNRDMSTITKDCEDGIEYYMQSEMLVIDCKDDNESRTEREDL